MPEVDYAVLSEFYDFILQQENTKIDIIGKVFFYMHILCIKINRISFVKLFLAILLTINLNISSSFFNLTETLSYFFSHIWNGKSMNQLPEIKIFAFVSYLYIYSVFESWSFDMSTKNKEKRSYGRKICSHCKFMYI